MPLPTEYKKLQHYPANTEGRDFVVGDVHGMYKTLLRALTNLQFDGTVDRLFSVGDLVDRGPESQKCAELIYEHWFYATRGNHEQMMIDALVKQNEGMAVSWAWNGGSWGIYGTPDEQEARKVLARDLDLLPLVITVGEGNNRFNITHAEMLHTEYDEEHGTHRVPITDQMIDQWCFSEHEESSLIWGRDIIQSDPTAHRAHDLLNMSPTFVGHTPIREPLVVQNHIYLDGGAVYGQSSSSHENALMIACPTTNTLHRFPVVTTGRQDIPFREIRRQI